MLEELNKDAAARMAKSVESLRQDLVKVRTGRATTSLLDHLTVEYYGNPTPLNQVASITVSDARTLTVTPWEKSMVAPIEKAIIGSDLGLNPNTAGTTIRIPLPPLTEERRRDLVKVVRQEGDGLGAPPQGEPCARCVVEALAAQRRGKRPQERREPADPPLREALRRLLVGHAPNVVERRPTARRAHALRSPTDRG